jgi:hypothetical protein
MWDEAGERLGGLPGYFLDLQEIKDQKSFGFAIDSRLNLKA